MTEPSSLIWNQLTTTVQLVLIMHPVVGDSWINVRAPVNAAMRLPDRAVWDDVRRRVVTQ